MDYLEEQEGEEGILLGWVMKEELVRRIWLMIVPKCGSY
jgi:hypothetical protein